MRTNHVKTEAEWRAQCAREWPHLPPADYPPLEPKAPLETKGLSSDARHQPFTDASWRTYCAQQWPAPRPVTGRVHHRARGRIRRTR